MKKILVLFLAIILVCAGIGFAATSTLDTGDSGNTPIYPGQDYGAPSTNTAQNSGNLDDNIGQSDVNPEADITDDQGSWYNGFWGDGSGYDNGLWDGKEDRGQIIIINNYINTESEGGNSESGIEAKSTSSNVPQQIPAEITEAQSENVFTEEIPMQKTGLPVIPALLSALLIFSGLLYRKLSK